MSTKTAITTANAPAPAAGYSQGVRKGPLLQVSGQGPIEAASGELLFPGDVAAQTTQTFRNLLAILEAGGASLDDVIMMRVYLTKREDFAPMNAAYGAFLQEHVPGGVFPARTTVFTGLPREGMLVEIDALAVVE
jgi:reactive intermediate/imine deaminase